MIGASSDGAPLLSGDVPIRRSDAVAERCSGAPVSGDRGRCKGLPGGRLLRCWARCRRSVLTGRMAGSHRYEIITNEYAEGT